MGIAIVINNVRVVGGVETYLDTVIPRLEGAGHEIALLCENDTPSTSRPISRNSSAPVWSVAEIGAERSLDSIRRWRPEVIYTHGLSDPEVERGRCQSRLRLLTPITMARLVSAAPRRSHFLLPRRAGDASARAA